MSRGSESSAERSAAPEAPALVVTLLAASPSAKPAAWSAFIAEFSPLLLHVAQRVGADRDERMDMYAHMLEVLQDRDCQRLRCYVPDGSTKFTTWLVVVARRICLDFLRTRFGRRRGPDRPGDARLRNTRIQLEQLINGVVDVDELPDSGNSSPDAGIRAAQMQSAVQSALASLTPEERLLLRMRFDDGMPAREIAQLLKMPSQFHVYRKLDALLGKLKVMLTSRGIEGSNP
jgi:RNA polymerase sigma factor (sigma-70 family)